jgi:hypothetical protein
MLNCKNLILLAERLEALPPAYSHFNMMDFVQDEHGEYVEAAEYPANITRKLIHNCGTTACAIGHAPTIRGLQARKDEDWNDYCLRVFGFERETKAWDFAFGPDWAICDDERHGTAHAAAKRLRYLATNGTPTDRYWDGYIDA